jgi:hypothetical protein
MTEPKTQTTKRPWYETECYPTDDGRPKMTKTMSYRQLEEHYALQILLVLLARGDNYDPNVSVRLSVSMSRSLLAELYPDIK